MIPHERTIANSKAADKLRVGDTVRFKGNPVVVSRACPPGRDNNNTATIAHIMKDLPGGVYLAQDLHGCRYWNADSLILVKRGKQK